MKKIFTLFLGAMIALTAFGTELVSGTYYTAEGATYYAYGQSGYEDATYLIESIDVTVNGDQVTIAGLGYFSGNASIVGTKNGNTITCANGQSLGTVQGQALFLVGTEDGQTPSANIVFTWDGENGVLAASTPFLGESASATQCMLYTYWMNAAFTAVEPEKPHAAVIPEGAEVKEYAMSSLDYQGAAATATAYVAIVGDTVYIQGFSSYFPEAALVGYKNNNSVFFPKDQFLGSMQGYDDYLMYDFTLAYDSDKDIYSTSTDTIACILGGQYIDFYGTNLVLTSVVEKAVMPANPSVDTLRNTQYGYVINYTVPNVDINGDGLVASKLFFKFYVEVAGEVSELTFTPATHTKLTENMTEIPYGFTEGYDFANGFIYLNNLYSADWDKIGIQSIYRGGDAENITEIQWYTIQKSQAIDNTNAAIKAVKRIENGVLIIEKNGVKYNAQGVVIK